MRRTGSGVPYGERSASGLLGEPSPALASYGSKLDRRL